MKTVWDHPDGIAELRKLWKDGLPTRAMAARISRLTGFEVTHNAVIGKVHRMGLHKEFPRGNCGGAEAQRVTGAIKSRAKQMKKAATAPKAKVLPRVHIIADVSHARPWLERERGQCAFPLGERGAVMSCCFPTDETYCPAHRQAMGGFRQPWTGKDHIRPQPVPLFSSDSPPSGSDKHSEAA